MTEASWRGLRIYTVGHSTRSLDELVTLLLAFGVTTLADIRTIPRSRHNPQFNADALAAQLPRAGIRYAHLAELGGLRKPAKDSRNTGFRNASFRGFADYMGSEGFEQGLGKLHGLARAQTTALMCAEAVPFRCHRSLVADALTARGAEVRHISSATRATPHRMTPFARVRGRRVTYPGDGSAVVGDEAPGDRLAVRAPFHLEATVRVLQRRANNPVDVWDDGRYLRALPTKRGLALVEVVNRGSIDEPDLRFAVREGRAAGTARAGLEQTLRKMLGLDLDPEPLAQVARIEPRLRRTALALRGMRPPRFAGLFEAFANVVPYQQVSVDAGAAITARFVERFGEALEHEQRRFRAFPAAEVVAEARLDALRRCGLSRSKAETLRRVARALVSGELEEQRLADMSSAEAVRFLSEIDGIGPWSASLVLLRGLGRLDVFPPGDAGAARALGELMQLESKAELEPVIARFGERRGYLYLFALAGKLLERQLIHPAPPPARGTTSRRSAR